MPIEMAARFTAHRFGWTWQQTLDCPAWLMWDLWRDLNSE